MDLPDDFYATISETLVRALDLAKPPVAICFGAEAAARLPRYSGRAPAGCSFWEKAMNGGFSTPLGNCKPAIGNFP